MRRNNKEVNIPNSLKKKKKRFIANHSYKTYFVKMLSTLCDASCLIKSIKFLAAYVRR